MSTLKVRIDRGRADLLVEVARWGERGMIGSRHHNRLLSLEELGHVERRKVRTIHRWFVTDAGLAWLLSRRPWALDQHTTPLAVVVGR